MARTSRISRKKRRSARDLSRRATEYFAAGDLAAAEKTCRRALTQTSRNADLWHLLAASLLGQTDFDGATRAAHEACTLDTQNPDFDNTRALILNREGKTEEAESAWRALLSRHPRHADAWYNLGRLLLDIGRNEDAIEAFETALEIAPAWGNAFKNLGVGQFALGDHGAAERAYVKAIECDPRDAGSYVNLACLRQEADDFNGAMTLFRTVLDLGADDASLIRFALLTPIFCDDANEIGAHRARVLENLAVLARRSLNLTDPSRALAAPAFYFAYQGLDDLEFQTALGKVVARAWQPPPITTRYQQPHSPRVVFVSAHFKQHTIGPLYAPIIERLSRDGFELHVLSIGGHEDDIASRIAKGADRSVKVGADLNTARAALIEIDADVIFYCDVGMDPWTYYLASERLAPVQCVTWGHPVTTGLASVDYFVSSRLIEPPHGAAHYSEALESLPCWPVVYDPPDRHQSTLTRSDFGFGASEHIYLCPQSLFKFHPDFDRYLAAILELDERAIIVLIDSRTAWRERLEARFAGKLGKHAARIRFLARQSTHDYAAMIDAADVVLDTIHFGGGYTSFEAMWSETPVVCERGQFMRGRVTAGLCDLLELTEPVTFGCTDYAEKAVAFTTDNAFRSRFIDALSTCKCKLLELDDTVLPAYRDFFLTTLAEAEAIRSGRIAS